MDRCAKLDTMENSFGPPTPVGRTAADQLFTLCEGRRSVDEYPSYGATPRATPKTPRSSNLSRNSCDSEAPRRSVSLIMKGLGITGGRKSARLSDADELQAYSSYNEDPISSRQSIASPFRVSLSIAGPVHIPEDNDLYADVEAARGYPVTGDAVVEAFDSIEADIGKSVRCGKPPSRISLKFIDVRYKAVVKSSAKWRGAAALEKEILHGITGSVAAGEMLAMMGPSGSGKTTLLNLLGGRTSNYEQLSGSILYNDLSYTKNLKSRTGFVTQDDVLFPHLTVRETLKFSALLRLPKELAKDQKLERAEDVLKQLGLQRCGDTVIGNQFLRGVSGGERKRVCIGQEILIDPSLIFLDEPTSGLDSTTALRLIQLLQNIAHEGRTVITTIHQPSSRAFHMFDKLILLAEGHSVYFGEASGAMTYFDSIGFSPLIPMNPADFLLDLCSGNIKDMTMTRAIKNAHHNPEFRKPDGTGPPATPATLLAKAVKMYLVECCENQISSAERRKLAKKYKAQDGLPNENSERPAWETTWWEQFTLLLIRGMKERRHEYLNWLRVAQVVLSALLAGCLWWQSKLETSQDVQDQVGLIFFIAVFWAYLPLFSAIFTFPLERAVLAKERASNMYRLSAYFMSRTMGDLPLDLALPFVFMIIIYFMAGMRHSAAAFFLSVFTVFLCVIASQGIGLLIGAFMMNVQKATTFASVVILAFMLSGGYFVQHIPPFIAWIKHLSFQAHTYDLLIQLQYSVDTTYGCSSPGGCKSIASAPALSNTSLHNSVNPALALTAMVFGYRALAYIALRQMKTNA